MPKDKTRSSRRKSRRLTDFANDVEMLEVDHPRSSERLKQKGKNRPGFQGKHEEDRKSRVSKSASAMQPLPGGLRGSQTARGSCATTTGRRNLRAHNNTNLTSTRAKTTTAAATIPLNPFAPRGTYRSRGRNFSVLSTLSAAQPGPWCDGCNRLNRQLHGYLLDVLRTGERAVDEWAYAVGASPDHMECEPAPERIIPEGYRRCSQQCSSCVVAGLLQPGEPAAGSGSGFVTPPAPSGWAVAGGGCQGQLLGVVGEAQAGGGGGPYARAAASPGATPDPSTPSPPGISAQVNHQLVAVPEGQNHHLHARWAGPPPAQAQQLPLPLPAQQQQQQQAQPWEASPQRGAADASQHNVPEGGGHWNNNYDQPGQAIEHGHHGVAMPLTPPKEPGDDGNDRARARRLTPAPVHLVASGGVGGGGGFEGRVMQWGVPRQ